MNNSAVAKTADKAVAEETVLLQFSIPAIDKLPGVDSDGASIATLKDQAARLTADAKKLSSAINEGILPYLSGFEQYGQGAGKLESETDDEYAERVVKATLPNGATVSIPVSVAFGETAVAMVLHLVNGGCALAKFEEFALSQAILKKAKASTNAGKAENFKPVAHTHGQFLFSLQTVGTDTNGNLKGFYEVLALAAKAVFIRKDEIAAMRLIDGMAEKTGIAASTIKTVVQFVVNASQAREMRKLAKTYETKAEEKRKAGISARMHAESTETIKRALAHQQAVESTRGLGQAH